MNRRGISTLRAVLLIVIAIGVTGGVYTYVFYWYGPVVVKGEIIARQLFAEKKWGDLQANLQMRYDKLPKLFQVVEASFAFEATVQIRVAEARAALAKIIDPNTGQLLPGVDEQSIIEANQALDNLIVTIRATYENYPDLKSIEAVKILMFEIAEIENMIFIGRRDYNTAVLQYNSYILNPFPGDYFNSYFHWGYEKLPSYEAVPGAENPPPTTITLPT